MKTNLEDFLEKVLGKKRNTGIAYLLFFVFGFGAFGVQKFYLNKFAIGLLYLFTGGLFGIGIIYDLFTLHSQVRSFNDHVTVSQMSQMLTNKKGDLLSSADRKEKIILRIAQSKKGIVTPMDVAVDSAITLEEAKKELDNFVSKGFADMEVSRTGIIAYRIFGLYGEEKSDLEKFE